MTENLNLDTSNKQKLNDTNENIFLIFCVKFCNCWNILGNWKSSIKYEQRWNENEKNIILFMKKSHKKWYGFEIYNFYIFVILYKTHDQVKWCSSVGYFNAANLFDII